MMCFFWPGHLFQALRLGYPLAGHIAENFDRTGSVCEAGSRGVWLRPERPVLEE